MEKVQATIAPEAKLSREQVWGSLRNYENLLHKISWKYAKATSFKVSKDDFFGELSLLYYKVRNLYADLNEKQFVKVLAISAKHKCIDIIVGDKEHFSYDDQRSVGTPVNIGMESFKELYEKFYLEDLEYLVKECPAAKDIFQTILDIPDDFPVRVKNVWRDDNLEEGQIKWSKRSRLDGSRDRWKICKIDIQKYLVKKGQKISQFRIGMALLKKALKELSTV